MTTREESKQAMKALNIKLDDTFKRAESEIYCLGLYACDIVTKNSKYKDKDRHRNLINGQLNNIVKVLKTLVNNYKDDNK